jgi:predicted CXXCH cytochrome family protein
MPHGSTVPTDFAPLWGHAMADTITPTFVMYTGYQLDASVASNPNGTSVLCLGCHDGQGFLDDYNGNTGTVTIGAGGDLGRDLLNDHPISIIYNEGGTDGFLNLTSAASNVVNGVGTIAGDLLDSSSRVQCASCHEPHNDAGQPNLLIMDNANDQLCNTCHTKYTG